ncbi:MAG TPA: ABC-F family ATP-binding cassette domain-containing protein [Methylomusa anaerophila]|uniref:Putative ABC transporter ATP-binding protein n=1 Tax=Methylomusa anaerophila TaxID=1930071 RepID=A0A348AFV7_9FIRM|nr:ABC-F family ATP-binding cassette domain-containing protein [Methylomusa anaerophila]BBB89955.1 putative ABC transporter ATP-binding protein [Methylomusa anaerophila]HML88318.1 ABC-F family ATP-binding cassette domain-containing protein [Methylomusa anaerophila]
MNLMSVENLAKSYGDRVLFDKVTFGIDEGDKIGLIGVNGTGKSTFLKVIAGVEPADAGTIIKGSTVRVEYLPQNPEFAAKATVLEQIFRGNSSVMQVLREYEATLEHLQKHPADSDAAVQKQLINLNQQMDALDAWQLESDAKTILTKLGIYDFSAMVGTLSGGQKKRIALAGTLINPVDFLILDEPTNHIDNATVAWLEEHLSKRKGALLMVTHDRYFLDRVTNRVIELDKGKLYSYSGNYSKFLEIKAEREEQAEAGERKRQNLLRQELAWIRRGAQARSTKQKARIERFEQLSAKTVNLGADKLEITAGASRLGRKVIELSNITHGFGQGVEHATFIRDFNYIVLKDDRVGIIGPNGSGKSTLLNLIAGRLTPDNGSVDVGQTVKVGYFSQENTEMNESLRVIEYIKEEASLLPTADGGVISASQMLERFLFPPNLQWMPVGNLSGGEKRRLFLLRILMSAPNVLLLDEPTNDLDVQTLTILEDYLDGFPGAVIIVSHDRYFLDRLVEKIFAFEGNGLIKQYAGGYSDYQEHIKSTPAAAGSKPEKPENNKPADAYRAKERPRKFTFKEQKEFEQIEDVITGVEQELQAVAAKINAAGNDFVLLQELTDEQRQLECKLDELLERWTYLNELAEDIGK